MKQPRNLLWAFLGTAIIVVAGWFGISTDSPSDSGTDSGANSGTDTPASTSQTPSAFRAEATSPSKQPAKPGPRSKAAATRTSVVAEEGTCPVATLPKEAAEVIEDIKAGGPFAHPDNDGVRFGNYERHLPQQARNYYREYTVDTPGLNHRGARRIVVGGGSKTDPDVWYYTSDHYDSFCEIPDAE